MPLSNIREIFGVSYLKPQKVINADTGVNLYDVDLAFNGQKTQHSTHALHTYIAAINPPLVKALIETYVPPHENILDPYCGGGGVLVEAMLSGHNCAGGDINPLSVIISRAKTQHFSDKRILFTGNLILEKAIESLRDVIIIDELNKEVGYWFKKNNLRELVALSNATRDELRSNKELEQLLQTILSGTIRDVMLTYRGEVRLRKLQGKDYDKFNPDAFIAFKKRLNLAAERVTNLPDKINVDVDLRDARELPFKNRSFHSIICSPPYADDKNGVGYFQFSKNMLAILGFKSENVKKYRNLFHGMTKEKKMAPKSKSLQVSLENVKKYNGSKCQEAIAFYSDYNNALKEMVRVTKQWIIIVVGNRVLARTSFDNATITIDLLKNVGVNLHHHYVRELRKKRIPNLGGDGGGINFEHVLVFKNKFSNF